MRPHRPRTPNEIWQRAQLLALLVPIGWVLGFVAGVAILTVASLLWQ